MLLGICRNQVRLVIFLSCLVVQIGSDATTAGCHDENTGSRNISRQHTPSKFSQDETVGQNIIGSTPKMATITHNLLIFSQQVDLVPPRRIVAGIGYIRSK